MPNSQLFQSFPTEVAQYDSERAISPNSQLFPLKLLRMTQNEQFHPNQVKLAALSHSEPLQWEKIGKVANRTKLAVQSHFEPVWWEKIGKVVNWAKLAAPNHSKPLR